MDVYRIIREYHKKDAELVLREEMPLHIFVAIIISIVISSGYGVLAGEAEAPGTEGAWHIVSDEISYDQKANQYIAEGNVTITRQDRSLSAEKVHFNRQTMEVSASGNVIMISGGDRLTGSSMQVNMNAETGTVYQGSIFLKVNNYYIKGDKIEKTSERTYTAEKVSVSTCEGDDPDWKITGDKLKITLEGYGTINHAALWTKKVPILYTPFFIFPAKTKRQSGLLAPKIGYSSRKGAELEQPLFWAINESSDATFYGHFMGKRGVKTGIEYRCVQDERSKSTLIYDYLNDLKIDDGTQETEKWGYQDDDGNNLPRMNADRYWFRMKTDKTAPLGFFARIDLDIVSDQDYLREFKNGITGFDSADEYFDENFGRDLDEYDDTTRVNRANLSRSWAQYSLNAELRWYDDIVKRHHEEDDTTLQKLPYISFDGSKQPLFKTPFYFDLNSEYTYFYRKDSTPGLIPQCSRADIHPRFYLPYKFRNYFNFEPSIGFRETAWYVDRFVGTATGQKRYFHRGMFDVKLDFSTDLFRIFNVNWFGMERIKHLIKPQVIYEYVPERRQDRYPNFDSIDRLERKSLVTYSLTNTFTSRQKKAKGPMTDSHPPEYTYRQICRFKIEQSVDLFEENEEDQKKWRNKLTRQPFYPLYAELEFNPGQYVSVTADAEWSTYESEFLSYNTELNLKDNRGDEMSVEYRYTKDPMESIHMKLGLDPDDYNYQSSESVWLDLKMKISERISAEFEFERDIHNNEKIKSYTGLLYTSQCWSIGGGYTDEDDDYKYEIYVNLHGLGGYGGDL